VLEFLINAESGSTFLAHDEKQRRDTIMEKGISLQIFI